MTAVENERSNKADRINKQLELQKKILQKILTGAIFQLAPAANHGWCKLFFCIGCMKRQHAVIFESIWETDSIIFRFPA